MTRHIKQLMSDGIATSGGILTDREVATFIDGPAEIVLALICEQIAQYADKSSIDIDEAIMRIQRVLKAGDKDA